MADVFWMQLGGHLVFALDVGGRIAGITYWLEVEGLEPEEGGALPERGWYWLAVNNPRNAHRVAEGLELRLDMSERELAETAEAALEEVANEVLAEEVE
jgi:hypothetical protein